MRVGSARLVGRTAELEWLREQTAAIADGRGGAVFVTGEAGMGKSRLVREAVTGHRGPVLVGRTGLANVPLRPLAYELSGGTLALDLHTILGNDWGAVQVQRVTAKNDGRELDCVEVLAHLIVDGVIVRTYHRPDQSAIDAFIG